MNRDFDDLYDDMKESQYSGLGRSLLAIVLTSAVIALIAGAYLLLKQLVSSAYYPYLGFLFLFLFIVIGYLAYVLQIFEVLLSLFGMNSRRRR